MKRAFTVMMLIGLICLLTGQYCYGANKQNASPATVTFNAATASRQIVFPIGTEDLIIQNTSQFGVYVDLRGGDIDLTTTDFDKGICYYLAEGQEINLYGFITPAITVYADGTNKPASPVSVLAIY